VPEQSVSVIIPTYQRSDLIAFAVSSALEQTHPAKEVIVIDDGSNDATDRALEPFKDRIIYRWQTNRGVSAARNAGLRLASGSIVAFLDADDRWLPTHLGVLAGALESHANAALACTGPTHPHLRRVRVLDASGTVDALCALLPAFGLLTTPSRVAVRRDALEEVGGFDEEMMVAEDSDLWVRLAIRRPFVLSSQSTIVRGGDSRSLTRLGMKDSLYVGAFERHAAKHLPEVRAHRPDDSEAHAHAIAQQHCARALVALAEGRERDSRSALEEALASAGWLSEEPGLVAHRVGRLGPRERAYLRFASAASIWPDPQSETAHFLRAGAFGGALRHRDARTAAGVLAHCPLRSTHRLLGSGFRASIQGDAWARL
jgi:hypothetical protein